ncbi:MAG: hypothetical protein J5938_00610, partial [Clostridia bacterium]|nr:hypothetical protein [Clostridia bacterium]
CKCLCTWLLLFKYDILIEVFSDKVVIYSPGSFPIGFTPEDFAFNAAEPIMLNPKIVTYCSSHLRLNLLALDLREHSKCVPKLM